MNNSLIIGSKILKTKTLISISQVWIIRLTAPALLNQEAALIDILNARHCKKLYLISFKSLMKYLIRISLYWHQVIYLIKNIKYRIIMNQRQKKGKPATFNKLYNFQKTKLTLINLEKFLVNFFKNKYKINLMSKQINHYIHKQD